MLVLEMQMSSHVVLLIRLLYVSVAACDPSSCSSFRPCECVAWFRGDVSVSCAYCFPSELCLF